MNRILKRTTRALAAAMALIFIALALAGCGSGGNGDGSGGKKPSDSADTTRPEFVYVAQYTPIGEDFSGMTNCCLSGERIYFVTSIKDGSQTYTDPVSGESWESENYRTAIMSCALDGSDLQEMTGFALSVPTTGDGDSGSYVNRMLAGPDGSLWVVEFTYQYTYELPADFDSATDYKWNYPSTSEEKFYLRQLATDGSELSRIDLSALKGDQEYFYLNAIDMDSQGNFCISCDTNLFVLDPAGQPLFTLEVPSWISGLVNLKDGSVGVFTYKEEASGYVMMPVDMAAKAFGPATDVPTNAYTFYDGGGDYEYYYSTDSEFFGVTAAGESVSILNWIDCDINRDNLSMVLPLPDGRVLCSSYSYEGESSSNELITLTKTPSSEVPEKTLLTYACLYMDYQVRGQIIKFNKNSDTYRIQVKDYSQYNTNDDYTLGLTKLNTEIISGTVPDIFSTDQLPLDQYAAKGLLEDLWPFIEADGELGGREGLVQPVFNALSNSEGKLYQIIPSFSIQTVVGASSVVGDTPGWTLDQLLACLDSMPQGTEIFRQGVTKTEILTSCLYMSMDEMVNWETGECRFDSDEFISYMEFANRFPATFDWENMDYQTEYDDEYKRIIEGRQMIAQFSAGDLDSFSTYKALYGGDVTFIGYPTTSGNGSAFSVNSGLAMSSSCKNKDAAWDFISILLSEDYQTENSWWGLPTNKAVFDKRIADRSVPTYTTDPVTGEKVEEPLYNMGWDGMDIPIYALKEDEIAQINDLIDSTDRIYTYDETLSNIILEEADAYFGGMKSVQEVAGLIQNRVSLYVNEQR